MRFAIEGALAIHYGRWIIKQAEAPLLDHVMIALIAISIVGSVFSIYRWMEGASGRRQTARITAA